MTKEEIREWVEGELEYEGLLPEDTLNHLTMCLEHITFWYNKGYPIGSFLTAVLQNDFMRATCLADDINRKYLYVYAKFIYDRLPADYKERIASEE